jgi:hypothetical protein
MKYRGLLRQAMKLLAQCPPDRCAICKPATVENWEHGQPYPELPPCELADPSACPGRTHIVMTLLGGPMPPKGEELPEEEYKARHAKCAAERKPLLEVISGRRPRRVD